MIEQTLLGGWQLFASPPLFLALVSGVALGFAVGLVPGLGGRTTTLLLLPFVTLLDPLFGAVFLIALNAVVFTSGSIPAIAYALPTSAPEAATVIDGFAMRRNGRLAEALGGSLSASALGGVFGAAFLLAAVPIAKPLVTTFGGPEMLMLSVLALTLVPALSPSNRVGGLAVGGLGLLVSTVGLDGLSGMPRYTFGYLELWDGVSPLAVIGGLFVVPELITQWQNAPQAEPANAALRTHFLTVFRGMASLTRYWWLAVRSCLIGCGIGMTPGTGASVAVWLAYGHAARTARPRDGEPPVGSGCLAGVIAPEAANNAKEGGAMIPTLFFGIPGSSGAAVLLTGLMLLGYTPGLDFLERDYLTTATFAWTIASANLLAIPLFVATAPLLVRFVVTRPALITALALVGIVTATAISTPGTSGLLQFAAAAVVGVALALARLPRAPFLIGYFIGPLVERNVIRTTEVWGMEALYRPWVLVLAAVLVATLAGLYVSRKRAETSSPAPEHTVLTRWVSLALAAVGVAAAARAFAYGDLAMRVPLLAAALVVVPMLITAWRVWRVEPAPLPEKIRMPMLWSGGFLAGAVCFGPLPASVGFLACYIPIRHPEQGLARGLLGAAAVGALQWLLLYELMGLELDAGALGGALLAMACPVAGACF